MPIDEHSVIDILTLQTMLIAVGVIMYSLDAEVVGIGVLLGVGFPVAVLLGGVVYVIETETDTTVDSQKQN